MNEHIPALDGLRGLAILLVIIYHTPVVMPPHTGVDMVAWRFLATGWLGVELFFVLSGFLISSILLRTRDDRSYFRTFWVRRALRIFPLYYAIAFASLVILPQVSEWMAAEHARLAGHEIWYWIYLQNLDIAASGFKHFVFNVTWSLAIEEQFYLIWPLVIYWLPRARFVTACLMLLGASFLFRCWLHLAGFTTTAVYVLTPGRIDGLVIGSVLAFYCHSGNSTALRVAARSVFPVMAVVLAASVFLLGGGLSWRQPTVYLFGFPIIAIFFASLLARVLVADRTSMMQRAFSAQPIRLVGKYSYAMYLFHPPLYEVLRNHVYPVEDYWVWGGSALPGEIGFFVLLASTSFLAAFASWHLFERHFLALKDRFPYEGSRAPVSQTPLGVESASHPRGS